MNVLLLSIDSLRRDMLACYRDEPTGFGYTVDTPNLDRFAERAAVFDTHYAGSLPCMPARREWLTGTQEFLWRPWGPIEPFDQTLPELARQHGVLTQLLTDHFHYIQHGSSGYYEDFNGFEFIRGHEYDAYKTSPREPTPRLVSQITTETQPESGDFNLDEYTAGVDPFDLRYMNRSQYARNVDALDELAEEEFFAPRVFSKTSEWLRDNREWDEWFCYVDSFDVHEPFHVPEPYASMYTDEDPFDPDLPNWPYYGSIDEGQSELTDREVDFVRSQFAGKVTMVDRWLGRVLDRLDREGLWEETMVVVTSDHGHFLGDHGWMGKPTEAPVYDVLAKVPLLVWHPESSRTGEHVSTLTSAVDLYATILDALGVESDRRHSRSLMPLLQGEATDHRDWALYGYWGTSVNVTDGEYTYLHPCDPDSEAHCHSTTMMDAYGWFTPNSPKLDAEAGPFLPYTDSPVWRFTAPSHERHEAPLLFDISTDPDQTENLHDESAASHRMRELLVDALGALDAPSSQYERLNLNLDAS